MFWINSPNQKKESLQSTVWGWGETRQQREGEEGELYYSILVPHFHSHYLKVQLENSSDCQALHVVSFFTETNTFLISITLQAQPEEQDNLQYASVHFSNKQADPLYSNIRSAQPHRHMEEQEDIMYAAVTFNRAGTAPRWAALHTGT